MALYTKEELIDFETDIANCFNNKMIKSPIHLYSNNEEQMIRIFDELYSPGDWVLGTWRFHYQCLLAGVPKDLLKQSIIEGKSITLAFPEFKVLASAIVAGILPIALGTSLAIKKSGGSNKVLVFVGDMASETGTFHEVHKYAVNFDLPIWFIVEDNGLSVCTDTKKTWGAESSITESSKVKRYSYINKYPHAGSGSRIQF